jgi:hypothetical protein
MLCPVALVRTDVSEEPFLKLPLNDILREQ